MQRRILFAAVLLAGALGPVAGAVAQQVLKLSHTDTAVGSRQKAAELFAEKVKEYTDGSFEVQVFHSGQLANDPKGVEQLQLGGIDFTVTAPGTYAQHQRTLNLLTMPYLVDSYEQGWKLFDESPWVQAQFDELPKKNIRILATWEAGFRSFTTTMPLNGPADAEGQKMRVYPNDMIRWIVESIGFSPVILPVTEVYLAIQQGTVIGQENPVDTIYSQRFTEVAPHLTLTQHVYSPLLFSISEFTWQRLSETDREAVTRAAKEAAAFSRAEVRRQEQGQLEEMAAKGAKIAIPDLGPFRAAVQPVYDKAREAFGADVDAVLAETQAIRESLPAASAN
jgi:TRAP-type transport system periplasmic protein